MTAVRFLLGCLLACGLLVPAAVPAVAATSCQTVYYQFKYTTTGNQLIFYLSASGCWAGSAPYETTWGTGFRQSKQQSGSEPNQAKIYSSLGYSGSTPTIYRAQFWTVFGSHWNPRIDLGWPGTWRCLDGGGSTWALASCGRY
jgi:hypothetical protein